MTIQATGREAFDESLVDHERMHAESAQASGTNDMGKQHGLRPDLYNA